MKWHIGKSSFSHGATVFHIVVMDGHLMLTSWSHAFILSGRQAGTHTHSQVMLYYADLLKVNLITLVIPDQRVFLPVKNPSSGKKRRKTWQQIKKWFHEGGTRDRPIHQNGGRVWTCCHAWCQARCQAVQGTSSMPAPWGCVSSSQGQRGR